MARFANRKYYYYVVTKKATVKGGIEANATIYTLKYGLVSFVCNATFTYSDEKSALLNNEKSALYQVLYKRGLVSKKDFVSTRGIYKPSTAPIRIRQL